MVLHSPSPTLVSTHHVDCITHCYSFQWDNIFIEGWLLTFLVDGELPFNPYPSPDNQHIMIDIICLFESILNQIDLIPRYFLPIMSTRWRTKMKIYGTKKVGLCLLGCGTKHDEHKMKIRWLRTGIKLGPNIILTICWPYTQLTLYHTEFYHAYVNIIMFNNVHRHDQVSLRETRGRTDHAKEVL